MMAQSVLYQGAWQTSYYQGAWQQQAQEHSGQTNENVAVADAVSVSIKPSSDEHIAVSDSLTVVLKHTEPESIAVQDAQAAGMKHADAENIAIQDAQAASIKHTEAESIGVADMSIAGQHIILSEQIEVADSVSVDIIHSESEQIKVSDSLGVKIAASQSESIAVSDQLTVVIRHEESENIGVADAVSSGSELATSEHIAVSDALSVVLKHTDSEHIVVSDALSVVLKHTEAEDVAVSDSQSGTLESAIKDPTDAAEAFTGTIASGRKHPRHGVKQVGIHADPILAVTTSSIATTFTKTSVTDAAAWDLSRVEAGYILVTGDGYSGIVQSTQGNTVNVNSWVRSGIDRRGLAADKPDDGLACTVHIAAEAQMISIRANGLNTGSMYLALNSAVNAENGHPIISTGTGSEVTIRSVHGQKLDLTRIWIVSPTSQKADWLLDGYSVDGKLLWGGTGEGITIKHTVDENIAVADALSVVHTEAVEKVVYVGLWNAKIEVVDVSDPANPSQVALIEAPILEANAQTVIYLYVRGDRLYAGHQYTAFHIFDTSTPATPVHLGKYTHGLGCTNGIVVTDDKHYLFLAENDPPTNPDGLYCFDISTPASPSEYSRCVPAAHAPNDIQFVEYETHILMANYWDLLLYQVSNPALIMHIATVGATGSPGRIAIDPDGRHVYTASGNNCWNVFDISDLSSITELWESWSSFGAHNILGYVYDVAHHEYEIGLYDAVVFVLASKPGKGLFHVFDISNKSSPLLITTLEIPGASLTDITIEGDYAYLAGQGGGLLIVDISDSSAPSLVSTFVTADGAESVAYAKKGTGE